MIYFKKEEFKMGSEVVFDKMNPILLIKLELLRHITGLSMTINSSYRGKKYNASVGGAKNSQHTKGTACDISTRRFTAKQKHMFLEEAFKLGFSGIGIYKTFIHLDVRKNKSLWIG